MNHAVHTVKEEGRSVQVCCVSQLFTLAASSGPLEGWRRRSSRWHPVLAGWVSPSTPFMVIISTLTRLRKFVRAALLSKFALDIRYLIHSPLKSFLAEIILSRVNQAAHMFHIAVTLFHKSFVVVLCCSVHLWLYQGSTAVITRAVVSWPATFSLVSINTTKSSSVRTFLTRCWTVWPCFLHRTPLLT